MEGRWNCQHVCVDAAFGCHPSACFSVRFRTWYLEREPPPPGTCWGDQSIRQRPETARGSGCQVLAAPGSGQTEASARACQPERRPWAETSAPGKIFAHCRAASPPARALLAPRGTSSTVPLTLTAVCTFFVVRGDGAMQDEAVISRRFHLRVSILRLRYLEGGPGAQDTSPCFFHVFPLFYLFIFLY